MKKVSKEAIHRAWYDHSLGIVTTVFLSALIIGCWLTVDWAAQPDKVSKPKAFVGLMLFSIVADVFGAWYIIFVTKWFNERKSNQGG